VRRIAREIAGELVTTIGNLVVTPNIVNAIPGRVTLSIDMRDPSDATLDRAQARLEPIVREACEREGVTYELEHYWRVPYTPFDARVVATVERAAKIAGARYRRITSASCAVAKRSSDLLTTVPPYRISQRQRPSGGQNFAVAETWLRQFGHTRPSRSIAPRCRSALALAMASSLLMSATPGPLDAAAAGDIS